MYSVTNKSVKLMQRGFTLVELLIVVIILAILAAIVIPQFSGATVDAQESSLDSNLNGLRSAIELYKVQHSGKYPGETDATGATCSVGDATTSGAAGSASAVVAQLTLYSSVNGATCTGAAAATKLGPYLRNGMPAEPINNIATVAVTTAGVPLTSGAGVVAVQTGGWAYDTLTGQIVMNSTKKDSKLVEYYKH